MNTLPTASDRSVRDDVALAKRLYMWLLIALAAVGSSVALYYIFAAADPTRRVCPLLNLTGIPCPSCGGSRAFARLLAGDFAGSLALNPNAMLVAVVLSAIAIMALYDSFAMVYKPLQSRMILPRLYRFVLPRRRRTLRQRSVLIAIVAAAILFEAFVWIRNIYIDI